MARCPNCDAVVAIDAAQCAACSASFTGPDAWHPVASNAEEAEHIARTYPLPDPPQPAATAAPVDGSSPWSLPDQEARKGLPFSSILPIAAGAVVGILVRVMFSGDPGRPYAAMMVSFLFFSPILVGAVTVYMAELIARRSWWYYIWAPFVANLLFVGAAFVLLLEGLICLVFFAPILLLGGVAGGLLMGFICRATHWPRKAMYTFAVLPLALGGLESGLETPTQLGDVERSIVVRAAPETVWRNIMHAAEIRPDEVREAWIFRIGVPLPLAGTLEPSAEGLVRKMRMGKDVHFDQVVAAAHENRHVRFTYRLYPDSFPPYALDDHVVVGGYYFDIQDTAYTLTPVAAGTELKVRMGYRVTTQFNWYSQPLARAMLGNFEETVLDFYRRRSEQP
jgi:hypothetical protein